MLSGEHINIDNSIDRKYFTKALGITREELIKAVQKFGTSVEVLKRVTTRRNLSAPKHVIL